MEATTAVLLGSVAGSAATLIGSFINNWFSSSQSKAQWDRQQQAEDKKWKRDSEKVENDRLREERTKELEEIRQLYQRCIQSLSALAAAEDENSKVRLTDDKRLALVEETHKTISALILRRPHIDPNKMENLDPFTTSPSDNAVYLRDEIIEKAKEDPDLFAQKKNESQPQKEVVRREGVRRINFHMDEDFRREQLVNGVELPRHAFIEVTLQELTGSQRQKFLDEHFQSNFTIPSMVYLNLPVATNTHTVDLRSSRWKARLNPTVATPKEILAQWESDYDVAMASVKSQIQKE